MVSEGGSDDDSLDGVEWKEEQVTEQDEMDAEEELPPELRYNGEGENVCSNLRDYLWKSMRFYLLGNNLWTSMRFYLLQHKSRSQMRDRQCPPSRQIQDGLPIRTGAIPMMRQGIRYFVIRLGGIRVTFVRS